MVMLFAGLFPSCRQRCAAGPPQPRARRTHTGTPLPSLPAASIGAPPPPEQPAELLRFRNCNSDRTVPHRAGGPLRWRKRAKLLLRSGLVVSSANRSVVPLASRRIAAPGHGRHCRYLLRLNVARFGVVGTRHRRESWRRSWRACVARIISYLVLVSWRDVFAPSPR